MSLSKEQIIKKYKEIVNSKRVILLVKAGSEALGLSDGDKGDHDEMGVYIEDPEELIGFSTREQIVWRSAEERTGKEGAKSEKGDIDLTLYGLRKFVRTALAGNPNMMNILFSSDPQIIIRAFHGEELQKLAPKIVSKSASNAFLGYLNAQRLRFLGSRGDPQHRVAGSNDDSMVYDKKYAMHACRLGKQGIELMQTGKLTLPMDEGRSVCMYIRRGDYDLHEVSSILQETEQKLKESIDTSTLQEKPDYDTVEQWLMQVYANTWWVKK